MSILEEIKKDTVKRVAQQKKEQPFENLVKLVDKELEKDQASGSGNDLSFENALKQDDIAFICEVKKASPSKGVISQDFPYLDIAKDFEAAGAAAISVLTEPHYFQGCDSYLSSISEAVSIPTLRKDFIVDEYMIYQAKLLGARAVLLICTILDTKTLEAFIKKSSELGLCALVETHDEDEVDKALNAGARIIGVNNRNLANFEVDIELSARLRDLVPSDKIFVSESGIHSAEDVQFLRDIHANAALVGEALMRGTTLDSLRA